MRFDAGPLRVTGADGTTVELASPLERGLAELQDDAERRDVVAAAVAWIQRAMTGGNGWADVAAERATTDAILTAATALGGAVATAALEVAIGMVPFWQQTGTNGFGCRHLSALAEAALEAPPARRQLAWAWARILAHAAPDVWEEHAAPVEPIEDPAVRLLLVRLEMAHNQSVGQHVNTFDTVTDADTVLAATTDPDVLVDYHVYCGTFFSHTGDRDRSRSHFDAAVAAVRRPLGNVVTVLVKAAQARWRNGEILEAAALLESAADASRASGIDAGRAEIAATRARLAGTTRQPEAAARAAAAEALDEYVKQGNVLGQAEMKVTMAGAFLLSGQLGDARANLRDCLELCVRSETTGPLIWAGTALAGLLRAEGHVDAAVEAQRQVELVVATVGIVVPSAAEKLLGGSGSRPTRRGESPDHPTTAFAILMLEQLDWTEPTGL